MFNYDLHPQEWLISSFCTVLIIGLILVWWWNAQESKPKKIINTDPPLAIPDVIVTISKYLDGTTKIQATNAYSVAIVETGKNHVIDTVLKEAGYSQHIQQYTIEPPQATLEASTTLEPVAVEVESPKKELPLTPKEAVAKMHGKTLDKLNEPFEPHPEIKA